MGVACGVTVGVNHWATWEVVPCVWDVAMTTHMCGDIEEDL